MRTIAVISGILLLGCSSVHKLVTKDKRSVDSTASVVKDTVYKIVEATRSDDLSLHNVDVTIFYDTGAVGGQATAALERAKAEPVDHAPLKLTLKTSTEDDRLRQLMEDAISAGGQAGRITAITFHADDISDSSSRKLTVDSGAGHTQVKTQVKTDSSEVNKNITRTSPVWILYAGAIVIFLIIILILLWRMGLLIKKN